MMNIKIKIKYKYSIESLLKNLNDEISKKFLTLKLV